MVVMSGIEKYWFRHLSSSEACDVRVGACVAHTGDRPERALLTHLGREALGGSVPLQSRLQSPSWSQPTPGVLTGPGVRGTVTSSVTESCPTWDPGPLHSLPMCPARLAVSLQPGPLFPTLFRAQEHTPVTLPSGLCPSH